MDTPLHKAVEQKQIKVVADLIDGGADVNAKGFKGDTPLAYALCDFKNSNEDIVKLLVKAGSDVNGKLNRINYYNHLLHLAVYTYNINIVKLLVEAGADINIKNFKNETPLHVSFALEDIPIDICKYLLDHGAEINAKNCDGETVLHYVAESERNNHVNVLKLLLKAGADVNAKSFYKTTPLHKALIVDNLNSVKLLLSAGADMRAINDFGDTPLHEAMNFGNINIDILKLTMEAGIDVNVINKDGDTPFILLIEHLGETRGNEEKILIREYAEIFIEYINVNLVYENGENILTSLLESDIFMNYRKDFYKIIIKHIAKLKLLNLHIDLNLLNSISRNNIYEKYFAACTQELEKAKNTRLNKCWVKFFNLLVDHESKFVKYAGNENLIKDFKKNVNEFPIYGPAMKNNVFRGISERKLFDGATTNLSYLCPIFDPTHLIIRDVLNELSENDWNQLCKRKRVN